MKLYEKVLSARRQGQINSVSVHLTDQGGNAKAGTTAMNRYLTGGHEAVAQFLAAPTADRRFESLTALANHFKISRMTLQRWKQDPDVLRRADWLSMQNKKVGDLEIRRAWLEIVAKMIEMAKNGNIAAIRMCLDCAFEEEKQSNKSQLSSESIGDVLARAEEEHMRNAELMTPSWLRERAAREAAKNKAAEESRASGEPKDPPE